MNHLGTSFSNEDCHFGRFVGLGQLRHISGVRFPIWAHCVGAVSMQSKSTGATYIECNARTISHNNLHKNQRERPRAPNRGTWRANAADLGASWIIFLEIPSQMLSEIHSKINDEKYGELRPKARETDPTSMPKYMKSNATSGSMKGEEQIGTPYFPKKVKHTKVV